MRKVITLLLALYSVSAIQAQCFRGAGNMLSCGSGGVRATHNNKFNLINNFTLEAWISPHPFQTSPQSADFIHKSTPCGNSGNYRFSISSDGNNRYRVRFSYSIDNTSTNYIFETSTTIPAAAWTHVAVSGTFTQPNTFAIYFNGIQQPAAWITPTTTSPPATNGEPFCVGVNAIDFSTPCTGYTGEIDELRVWNARLTQQSIKDWYKTGLTPFHPNWSSLVTYYTFNNNIPPVLDLGTVGPLVNPQIFLGQSLQVSTAPINEATNQCMGYALDFNNGGRASLHDVNLFDGLNALTYQCWVYPTAYPTQNANNNIRTIISKGDYSAGNTTFALFFQRAVPNSTNVQIRGHVYTGNGILGTGEVSANTGSFQVPLNQWTHVAITWNSGSQVRIFINGQQANLSAALNGTIWNSTSGVVLGSSDPVAGIVEEGFKGYVDEVAIFNSNNGFPANNISSTYTNRITPTHPNYNNLLSYWRFQDSTIRTVADEACPTNNNYFNTLFLQGNAGYAGSLRPCSSPDLTAIQNLTASNNFLDKTEVKWTYPTSFPLSDPSTNGQLRFQVLRNGNIIATISPSSYNLTYLDTISCSGAYAVRPIWVLGNGSVIQGPLSASVNGQIRNINVSASNGTHIDRTIVTWNNISQDATGGIEITRNGQQVTILSSPNATQYTDFDGTPGIRYVYGVRPVAVGKNYPLCATDTGWIRENGRLSGYVRSPLQAPVPGVTVTATATIDNVTYTYSDTTDASGFYEIRNVYYNTQATYTLVPSKGTHQFNPASLQRTLDVQAFNAPQANFIDTSVFTVSGKVTFPNQIAQPGCPNAGVTILVNGTDQGVVTNNTGDWSYTVQEPATFVFTPVYKNHSFNPPTRTLFVNENKPNISFSNITTDTLYISLKGYCDAQVADASTVNITGLAVGGCFQQTVVVPGNDELAVVLPAQEYMIELGGVTYAANANMASQIFNSVNRYQFVDLSERDSVPMTVVYESEPLIDGGDTIVLPNGQIVVTPFDTLITYDTVNVIETPAHRADYIYGGTLKIDVLGLDTLPGCTNILVNQGNIYQVRLNVSRVYTYNNFTQYCALDTGLMTIFDDVSDSSFVYYVIDSGIVRYNMNPGKPNIVGNGPHPYQKFLFLSASTSDAPTVSTSRWMIVQGNRSLTPTFVTKTPELPFFVLHDPPGDGSSASLSQGTTLSFGYETGVETAVGTNSFVNIQVGTEVPVPFTGIVFSAGGSLNLSLATNTVNTSNKSVNTSFTVMNSYSTSDAEDFVGEDADIVVGASLNMIYGLSYIVNYDTANCVADLDTALTWGANDFATTYAYTIGHIKHTLIPQLTFLRDFYVNQGSDSALIYQNYINVWNQVVEQNSQNIEDAEFAENRSFSAGVTYSKTSTFENTSGYSISYQTSINPVIAAAISIGTENNSVEFGTEVNMSWTTTTNKSNEFTNSKEVSYTLTDDDPGDFFSVDIARDKVYGTPAFRTVAGTSSCPHEEGTQQRDMASILVLNPLLTNVPVNQPAVFTVQMTNLSESQENRTYSVIVDPSSNLDGAIIRLGGQLISQFPASFTIPANASIFATLSVEKGPVAVNYNNIKLIIYSPCDPDISAEAQFSVAFQSNCSPIQLFTPSNNWLVNNQSDTLIITYGGFNANDTSLTQIGLEIRRPGQSWSTIPASLVSRLQLQQNNFPFYAVALNMGGFADGDYEIRAFAICNTLPPIRSYSATLSGKIARASIALFGTPSPTDGVLNVGEDISVTFNAPLDCTRFFNQQNLVFDSVTLRRIDNGQLIPSTYVCSGSQIIINTNPPSLIDNLQNVGIRARVKNIYDANGNILQTPIVWSFVVNRSKQYWDPSSLSLALNPTGTQNVTAALKNDDVSAASFTITKVPAWMSTPTTSGTVPAGNFNNINFTVNANLNPGTYNDTVIANFGGGNVQYLFVQLVVKHPAPYWAVNPAQYQYSMNIIANYSLTQANAPLSTDVNDRIAVFSGNQLRGVGNITYQQVGNVYAAFITVYSNSVAGEPLRFRMWDASTGIEYEAVQTATFVNNAVLGQQLAPMILNPAGRVQRIPVASGWNWFSLNVVNPNMGVNNILRYLAADSAMIVKTDDVYAQFSPAINSWAGSLSAFNYQKSYMIWMTRTDTLEIVGNPLADTVTIPLAEGWNWMGYPQLTAQPVNTYMQSFGAANNDVLKSQTQFATYSGGAWSGSLAQMQPGRGYKLQTANTGTLTVEPNRAAPSWNVSPYEYEYNMNITATLRINGADSYGGYLIGAFVNNICVGVTGIQSAGGFARVFMTLHGSLNMNNQPIEFKVYEFATDSIYTPMYTPVTYLADGQNGSVENPFVLSFASPWNGVAHINNNGYALYQNVPNPFTGNTAIRFVTGNTGHVKLQLFDYTGKLVRTLADGVFNSGEHVLDFANEGLLSGIYFYRMQAGDFTGTKKMIIQH